jgi:2-hydroxycyclohexanecarboxyl-CoA dehydrogenase
MTSTPPAPRTALVTGGASGIGRAIARRLAAAGDRIAILDVDAHGATQVAEAIVEAGGTAVAARADVADGAQVGRALEVVRTALGPVHVLVNNAGICSFAPFEELPEREWDRTMAVIAKGAFHCVRAVLPDMTAAGWGRIVNVSSLAAMKGAPSLAHYAAAKAAVLGFTKALATELGPRGITVNAIAPGLVETPLLDKSGLGPEARRAVVGALPIARIGVPDDIAAACAYLVSPDAGWTTGQVLSPNGGAYM